MMKISNLENILNAEDINESIIELDTFICEICDYGENLSKLTDPQKLFYYNQNLEREINNGGFNQYFINDSGDNAHETIISLKTIGAEKTADILQKAIEYFPNKMVPKDRDERIEIVENIEEIVEENWTKLEEEFYEYADDLNTLNIEYIKKHKDFF